MEVSRASAASFTVWLRTAENQWLPTPVERPSDWKAVATLAAATSAAGIGGMQTLHFCPTKLIYMEKPWPRLTSQANYPSTVKAQLWAAGYTLLTLPALEKWTMNIFALLNSTKLDVIILCFEESRKIQIQDLPFPTSFPTLHMTGHHKLTALGVFLFLFFFFPLCFWNFRDRPSTPYKQTLTVW